MNKTGFTLALACLFNLGIWFGSTSFANEPDAAAAFVIEVKDAALALYTPEISEELRHERLCAMMEEHVNIEYVGKVAAGRFTKQMSEGVRQEFYLAVKAKLVRFFDLAFARLRAGTVTVHPVSRPAGPTHVVTVEVAKPNRSVTKIQFHVAPNEGTKLLLQDAQMSGFSLSQIFRDEFTNILDGVPSDDPDAKGKALIDDMNSKNTPCPLDRG